MKKMFTNFNQQKKTVQDAIVEFLNTKRGRKAEETVNFYEIRLDEFSKYLEKQGITEVQDITRRSVESYIN